MKILLVDDDEFLRDMYALKFRSSGYDVTVADGSVSALTLLDRGIAYDLLIVDMIMPGTTGVELLNIINEKFPKQIKYCIFLSNQGQDEDIREAKEAGAIGYIIKASSIPSEVVTRVEEIIKEQK